MNGEIVEREQAIASAKEFADEDDRCVGEFGEVLDVTLENGIWTVTFRTHTYAEEYRHEIQVTSSVGNVISYERESRFD